MKPALHILVLFPLYACHETSAAAPDANNGGHAGEGTASVEAARTALGGDASGQVGGYNSASVEVAGKNQTAGANAAAGLGSASLQTHPLNTGGPSLQSDDAGNAGNTHRPGLQSDDAGNAGNGGAPGLQSDDAGNAGNGAHESLMLVTEPTFTGNDNDAVPLVGIVRFETNVPTAATILVSGGEEEWTLEFPTRTLRHERVVLGVKPDTLYEVVVTVTSEHQELVVPPLQWSTPAVPGNFPRLDLVQSDPSRMEPGMTIFDFGYETSRTGLIVVDALGTVRWWYDTTNFLAIGRLLANGNHVFIHQGFPEVIEMDWRGNRVTEWRIAQDGSQIPEGVIALDVPEAHFHHSIHEMPNGNLLTLCREHRSVENYPTSTTDREAPAGTAKVRGDVIIEFTREGEIVKHIPLLDLLDPTRVGHDAVSDQEGFQDWSHGNAAVYDAASDAYLVSLRNQDAVAKIDRTTESLVWILGNHANWGDPWQPKLLSPTGDDFRWQYHQHAAAPSPEEVCMYDNGNHGAPAFQPVQTPVYSRAVCYGINEDEMTIVQLWSYGPSWQGQSLFAGAGGDADRQPSTRNVLITSASGIRDGDPLVGAQVIEVSDSGEPVFELHVREERPFVYGADRIPDIRRIELD